MCNKVNLRILQHSINMCIKKSYFDRSSHLRCSVRKGFPRNFAKFTGKHLCQSLFFNKVAGLRPATLLKKRIDTGLFLRILQNFQVQLFYRKPLGDCFCFDNVFCNNFYIDKDVGKGFVSNSAF